jgi:ABC-type lipopolysaccharide export system ATPase subunit
LAGRVIDREPYDAIPRDEIPPVLTYKLQKIYPSLGGLPAKVALKSLDLHVPKGQVLGLLGKNGAGYVISPFYSIIVSSLPLSETVCIDSFIISQPTAACSFCGRAQEDDCFEDFIWIS